MLELTYQAAVTALRGWSDRDILRCDLRRLSFAIDASQRAREGEWRQRYRLAGWKVEEPFSEPETDEDFNANLRATMAMFRNGA